MSFLEKTKKKVYSLNLSSVEGRADYNEILEDPAVRILSKKYYDQKSAESEGDYRNETSEQILILEVEECDL